MGSIGTALLPNAIAICLVAGLALTVLVRRPARALWPVLFLYQLFALVYLIGDAVTGVASDMFTEQVGIALIYTGSFPAAAACWLLAIRYADAQGQSFRWAHGAWIRGPVAFAAVAWLFALTNPWHGQFVVPVIGAHNEHLWGWWLFVPWGYVLVSGAVLLYTSLALNARDEIVRTNAWLMASGICVTLVANFLSYLPAVVPFDFTVVGLGGASALFLFGAYRTRLFSLVPVAVVEAIRHDPNGLVLVDLQGTWLRSNPAATKLLGSELKQPGRDVVALLARCLRGPEGEPLRREDLARRLLQGPRAVYETVGPLLAGEGHWIEIIATPIPRFEGRARAVSLRLVDVSSRIAAEEQLRRSRRELKMQTDERRAVDLLLGDILRDSALAAGELDDPDRAKRLLVRVRRAAEQARQMTGAVVSRR